MTDNGFDPVLHEPARLRIAATLAALPDGDALSVTRLRDLAGLAGRDLTTGLGELGQAGYVRTDRDGGGDATGAIAALTGDGEGAEAAGAWPLAQVLAGRGVAPVSYAEWLRIETAETDLARSLGRGERVKLHSSDAIWSACRPGS